MKSDILCSSACTLKPQHTILRLMQVMYDVVYWLIFQQIFIPLSLSLFLLQQTISCHSSQHWEWPHEFLDKCKVSKHYRREALYCFCAQHLICREESALSPDWETGGIDLKQTWNLKQSHPTSTEILEKEGEKVFFLIDLWDMVVKEVVVTQHFYIRNLTETCNII